MTRPPSNANFWEVFPGPPPENNENPRGFWRTTGCATVIAALIGAGATLLAVRLATPSTASAPPTVTVTVPGPSDGGAPPPPGPPGADQSDVLWKNHFNMGNYVDFDSIPPRNDAGVFSQDGSGGYDLSDSGTLWESPTPPTKQQCIDRIATHGQDSVPTDVGTQICYRTPEERVVYIKVLALDPSSSSSTRYETEVTIWRR